MKLWILFMLVAVATCAPQIQNSENYVEKIEVFDLEIPQNIKPESRNILINILVRQLFNYIRRVINEGSYIFGIPPLDPLELEEFQLNIPAGIINLQLDLQDALATGFGGFVVHRSNLALPALTFDIDISIPNLKVRAGLYDLLGDFLTALPLYGKGEALFDVGEFRFQAVLHLKQSEDEKSVLIDWIENPAFQISNFKTQLTGVIGGGDIDAIVNALVDEVLIDYINRFQGAISFIFSKAFVPIANPFLDRLNTWRFISIFM